MPPKCRWLLIAIGGTIILLVTPSHRVEAYEWITTLFADTDEYATPAVHTSTRWEDATASADADAESGVCSCGVHTYSDAMTDDSADAYAQAWGAYRIDWVWSGPPGTSPAGLLLWEHDGQGGASIEAYRLGDDGGTHCAASATSTSIAVDPYLRSECVGGVTGSVYDNDQATGDPNYYYASAGADHYHSLSGGYDEGMFNPSMNWWVYDYVGHWIPAGTGQFNFQAGVVCVSESEASATGAEDVRAWADTYTSALIRATVTFNSN